MVNFSLCMRDAVGIPIDPMLFSLSFRCVGYLCFLLLVYVS